MLFVDRLMGFSSGFWAQRAAWFGHRQIRRTTALSAIARHFEIALRGLPTHRANPVRARIRRAASATDFWHLRVDVFIAVSRSFGQQEAEMRLRDLNTLFRSGSQRTGPLPLAARH